MCPQLSVITVTYMNLDGLIRTRNSVKKQQGIESIQHIVIDGGSGSEVRDYLEGQRLEDRNFAYVSEPDGGIYEAMNKGLALATGDLFCWLNSGDTFAESNVTEFVAENFQDPKNQWGYGILELLDAGGKFSSISFPNPYNSKLHQLGLQLLPHPSAFFGRNIVEQIGGYNTSIGVSADQVFMIEAAAISSPLLFPRVLTTFEAAGASSTISLRKTRKQIQAGLINNDKISKPSNLNQFTLTTIYNFKELIRRFI